MCTTVHYSSICINVQLKGEQEVSQYSHLTMCTTVLYASMYNQRVNKLKGYKNFFSYNMETDTNSVSLMPISGIL